jgi:replicative DNA helicase
MPANEELRLISKIVDSGDLKEVLDAGVTIDHFRVRECRILFKAILDYYHGVETKGYVPTRDYMEARHGDIPLAPPDRLGIGPVLAEFRDIYVRGELENLSLFIADHLREPDKALTHLHQKVRDLSRGRRTIKDVVVADAVADALLRYESSRNTAIHGIPYPWAVLNHETRGLNNGEFIVLYGRPKSLKTWVLLKIATHAYERAACRVLIYTREMTTAQMVDRCLCLLIGAPYSALKQGTLDQIPVPEGGTMEDRLRALIEVIHQDEQVASINFGKDKSLIITSDRDDPSGGGVRGLEQKVNDHQPDLICVDAVYLMRDDRENKRSIKWDSQSNITQDIKDLALSKNRPVVITTQANRGSEESRGESMANIAFADAYGMNCDLAMEINKRMLDAEHNELAMCITGAREINLSGFAIHGDPATNFSTLMRRVRNNDGIIVNDPANGAPLMEPVIFQDLKEVREFFKDTEAKAQEDAFNRSRLNGDLARIGVGAFNSASRRGK